MCGSCYWSLGDRDVGAWLTGPLEDASLLGVKQILNLDSS